MILGRVDNRALNRAIAVVAAAWILLAGGFGLYYYSDRYGHASLPIVDRGIEQMAQILEADPSDLDARAELALYFLEGKMLDDAIEQSEAVLLVKPDHQGALFVAGKAYLAKENEDKSAEYFGRIVELNKENQYARFDWKLGIVHYDLGNIFLKRGQYARAEGEFQALLMADRTDADAYFGLGQSLMEQQKLDLAIEAFRSALRLDPEHGQFYEGLKEACDRKGLKDYAAFARAMLLYTQGNCDEALAELQRVAEALPEYSEVHRALGMSYERIGKRDEAVRAYRRALELDPGDRASEQGLKRLD